MATKTTTSKATEKTATPKASAADKRGGLRKPMVRILKALSKAKAPLTRSEIAEKAPCDVAGCVEWIGSSDADVRKANDTKHFPSLITLGLVKIDTTADGHTAYTITAKGKALAAKVSE
jgi:predicted transcriptional regulator with HTH domain